MASARMEVGLMPEAILSTIEETAKDLRCGRTKVYELLDKGELESVKLGKLRRIVTASIGRYVEKLVQQNVA